jgi:biotin transport system substrate-specific component
MTQQTRTLTEILDSRAVRYTTAIIAANALLVLSAKIQVPFWPVPMTMQTFAVLAVGMGLGFRAGAFAIGLYLLEGALGFPVFSGTPERGIGIAYMTGPTGGYLAGFLLAGAMLGIAAERGWTTNYRSAAISLAGGHIVILALGAVWLATIAGWQVAWSAGFAPFLASTVVKCGLGVALCGPANRLREWI